MPKVTARDRAQETGTPITSMGWDELENLHEDLRTRQKQAADAGKMQRGWALLRDMGNTGRVMRSMFPFGYQVRQTRLTAAARAAVGGPQR